MHHEGMTLHQRTVYLPTDNIKKLTAYQHHITNLCWKHDCLIGEPGNVDENPVFLICWPTWQLMQKNYIIMSKVTGHEKMKITAKLLILANRQKPTAFDTLKKNFVVQLYIKVMRKGQMADSSLGHITRCSSKGRRNVGFICFQVSCYTWHPNFYYKFRSSDTPEWMTSDLQFLM